MARRHFISGNHSSAYGGGIANFESDPILTNVQISGNVAHEFGGGIYNGDSNPKLINVTIAGNRANGGGGIRNYDWSDMELQNSIVWGNTANIGTQILNKEDSDPIIGFSLIEGGLTEPGVVNEDDTSQVDDRNHNLDADPRFVNPVSASNAPASDGNYRLRDNSPALDRGDNTVNDSETDCDGQPRIVNSTIDLGAYEGVAGIATTGTFDPPGGTLELADGHITIPPDALRETTTMTYTDVAAHRSQLPETTSVLRTFTLEGHTGAGLALEQFNQPVSIVFNYPLPTRLAGTAGAQPVMLFWDPYAEQWLVLGPTASCPSCGISVDQQAGTVTAVTIHITEYALVLQDSGGQILYLPIVWR